MSRPWKLTYSLSSMSFNDVIRTFLIYMYFMRGYIRKSSFILHASNDRNWVTARNVVH